MMKWLLAVLLLTSLALAANPQDEQVVRTAYAKLAFASQARTVYSATARNPKLKPSELAQKLQANELRFQIIDMSSGMISDILSRRYSDLITPPPQLDSTLSINLSFQTVDENGQRFTSTLAGVPRWTPEEGQSKEDWNMTIQEMIRLQPYLATFSRYVAATITVTAVGKSKTYQTLWLFGSNDEHDALGIDIVTGLIVRDFARKPTYPSVLTDTHHRSYPAVQDWLQSNQRLEATCKRGKMDVCCDTSSLQCGVAADDLRSTKPAPSTTAIPKKEGL